MARRKRRFWSVEEKRSICLQTLAPGVSVSKVARRHAMNANQIFNWLKDPRFAPVAGEVVGEDSPFLPVEIVEPEPHSISSQPASHSAQQHNGRIEIALVPGHRLTVEGRFDGCELAHLLKGLMS